MSQFSFLQSLDEAAGSVQQDLKNVDGSDAGKYDVADKASAVKDVSFNTTRHAINSEGEVSGSDVADFIERAEEINDEVDTVAFGLETDDGYIVKVYVNANDATEFEEALSNLLGLDSDLEDSLNTLAADYDIVDIVWPKESDESPAAVQNGVEMDSTADATKDDAVSAALKAKDGVDDDDDDIDDFEVVAALPDGTPTANPVASMPDVDKEEDAPAGGAEVTSDNLPDVPGDDDTNAPAWEQLTDIILQKFPDDESIVSINDLSQEQLAQVINIEQADKIAAEQYDAADFASLDLDEKEDIVNANPELILNDEAESDEAPGDAGPDVEDEGGDALVGGEDEMTESLKRYSFLATLL